MVDMMRHMMGEGAMDAWAWLMMVGMGIFLILFMALMVFAIIWLIKNSKK